MAKRPGTDGSPGMERAGRLRGLKVARMLHVAADSGADPAMLLRLCRALAAFGVCTVDAAGRVGQSPLSATLRGDARPTLLHAARYRGSAAVWASRSGLERRARSGEPTFEAQMGAPFFAWLRSHPEEAGRFDGFMRHSPVDQHRAVAAAYDFGDAGTIVDVGALLAAVRARCAGRSGSFFAEVQGGDARGAEILGACRRAMRPGARLLVIERLLGSGDAATDRMNDLSDMHMMALFPGAREGTAAEYEALLAAAGFAGFRTIPTASAYHVMETRAA